MPACFERHHHRKVGLAFNRHAAPDTRFRLHRTCPRPGGRVNGEPTHGAAPLELNSALPVASATKNLLKFAHTYAFGAPQLYASLPV